MSTAELKKPAYDVFGISDIRCLTKLRNIEVNVLSTHRFGHKFDCSSPVCSCGMIDEDNEHLLLYCQRFYLMRSDLLGHLSDIPGLDIHEFNTKTLCELLL